jgi:hypothetical protein
VFAHSGKDNPLFVYSHPNLSQEAQQHSSYVRLVTRILLVNGDCRQILGCFSEQQTESGREKHQPGHGHGLPLGLETHQNLALDFGRNQDGDLFIVREGQDRIFRRLLYLDALVNFNVQLFSLVNQT